MRYFWHFSIVAIACLISIGCAPITQPPRETITFDYVPTVEAPPGSADVTFAIVGTQFVAPIFHQTGSLQQGATLPLAVPPPPLFEELVSNMTKDFSEVLTARGFTVKGVYRALDEMIYPDKEGSDLILTARIEFRANTSRIQYTRDIGNVMIGGFGCLIPGIAVVAAASSGDGGSADVLLSGVGMAVLAFGGAAWVLPANFVPSGSVDISSEVILEAYEGLTNEVLWSKIIIIPPFTVAPKAVLQHRNLGQITWQELMKIDNEFYSDMGRAFEGQYDNILSQIYTYLDPREMAIVKNQAMELRKRKVY